MSSSRPLDLDRVLPYMRRLRLVVCKGNWAEMSSNLSAESLCDEAIQMFEAHPPDVKRGMNRVRDLRSLVERGNWADMDDCKPYAQLLCDHVIVMLESIRESEPERVLESHGEVDPTKPQRVSISNKEEEETERVSANQSDNRNDQKIFKMKLMAIKKQGIDDDLKKNNEKYPSASSSKPAESKRVARSNRPTMTKVINQHITGDDDKCVSYDGFKWKCYGRKNIRDGQFPRYYYRCAVLWCPAKKHVQRINDFHIEVNYFKDHNCEHQVQGGIQEDAGKMNSDGSTQQEFVPMKNEIIDVCPLLEGEKMSFKWTRQSDPSPTREDVHGVSFPQISMHDGINSEQKIGVVSESQQDKGERMKQNFGPNHCIKDEDVPSKIKDEDVIISEQKIGVVSGTKQEQEEWMTQNVGPNHCIKDEDMISLEQKIESSVRPNKSRERG